MSNMGFFPPPSAVRSIQRGTTSAASNATTNVTINNVNTNKAWVNLIGLPSLGSNQGSLYAQLTSGTNLALVRTDNVTGTFTFSWEVIEYA